MRVELCVGCRLLAEVDPYTVGKPCEQATKWPEVTDGAAARKRGCLLKPVESASKFRQKWSNRLVLHVPLVSDGYLGPYIPGFSPPGSPRLRQKLALAV